MSYYMRGDYYRGDPFLGGLIGAAVGAVGSLFKKKAISKIGGAVGSAVGKISGRAGPIIRDIGLPLLGGGAVGAGGTAIAQRLGPMVGFGGGTKRRRMNPLNPRALRRAIRRAEGFEAFARKTVNALYKTSSCGCSTKKRRFKKA